MNHVIDKNFFPGWVRKSVGFTIDDGNIEMDKKFLDIVRPAGILGTFNLCGVSDISPEEYREIYQGYEIANHVKLHPHIFEPGIEYPLTDEVFNLDTADPTKFYRHPDVDGVYFVHGSFFNAKVYTDRTKWWFRITDADTYVRLIDMAHREFEEVFGKGSVRSFVWPFGKQTDYKKALEHVQNIGYYGARDAGSPSDSFDMPAERIGWKYCATDWDIVTKMEKFESLPDDGNLKFFCFGVHSIDYDRGKGWERLSLFAERFGNRQEKYFYGTIGQIFDYEDAIKALVITDTTILNSSDLTLYLTVDGERVTLAPKSTYEL